jgi:hypothetical protein
MYPARRPNQSENERYLFALIFVLERKAAILAMFSLKLSCSQITTLSDMTNIYITVDQSSVAYCCDIVQCPPDPMNSSG